MDFEKPVIIFIALNNIQAHQACGALLDAGIDAYVVEDVSNVGMFIFGFNTTIHRPKVWIDQSDTERAKPILEAFEARLRARLDADNASPSAHQPIAVTCERCGKTSEFPAVQKGSVQKCPICGATVDVGEDDSGIEGWDQYEPEE